MNLKISDAPQRAFSLLEVMIAIAIFFVAAFAILGLISTSLQNVRRLQRPTVDASQIRPRCCSTIFLQIARPIPVPGYSGPCSRRKV